MKYSHVWHPGAGCQISFIGYTLKLCAYDVDFNNVKIEDLTDIRKIKIDKNQPQSKRQAQFLKQVGNPYMLRRGSMMIKVSFANNGLSMEQAFENLLLNV